MKRIYRLVAVALLAFMFRSSLWRLQQTGSQYIRQEIQGTGPAITYYCGTEHAHSTYGKRICERRRAFSSHSALKQAVGTAPRPDGLVANKGLELLTFGTPNGHKSTIILEELKEAYGKPEYVWQSINIGENIQKEPWYTEKGPNGRIPVLIDHDRGGLGIMEGAAIMSYLTRHFDPEHKLSFSGDPDLSVCEQWVAWQHGGLGPMQGQANHFYRLAKERIPYPTQRYVGETERLYGVLDIRLKDRDYLVGSGRGKYSIADIANFSWVNTAFFSGVDLEQFPNLYGWWERINARPAVQRGTAIPSESKLVNAAYKKRLAEEPEFKAQEDRLTELGRKAKEQYNYKFAAP